MTAFTTLCWRSAALDALRLTLVLLLSWTVTLSALAQSAAEVTQLRLERDGESVLLSAVVQFDLSPTVEEALLSLGFQQVLWLSLSYIVSVGTGQTKKC